MEATAVTQDKNGRGGEDSDDETDDFIRQRAPPSAESGDGSVEVLYRQIVITDTAYSTYRAVLVYLHTSHITFAPLASLFSAPSPAATHLRFDWLDKALTPHPSLPLPVSPKGVYRLAHLLEHPKLMSLALADLKIQLDAVNAAVELFSETSAVYDDLRKVVLDWVVDNWKTVKDSAGMKEVDRRVKVGELPHAGKIYAELVPRVL